MFKRIVSCLILGVSWGTASNASAELIGYYPFNGNANEATGNNTDLNLVGDAGFGASVHPGLGAALSLDGDGDAAIGQSFVKFAAGGSATVVAWVYAASLDGEWNTIVKNWGETTGGQFHFGLGNDVNDTLQTHAAGVTTVTDDAPLPAGEWLHTAWVLDAGALENRLYINGEVAFSVPLAITDALALGNATGLGVGVKTNDDGSAIAASAQGYWNGLIDEVGLYDEALSTAQILDIYQNGLAGIQLDGTSVPEPSSAIGALLVGTIVAGYAACRRHRERAADRS